MFTGHVFTLDLEQERNLVEVKNVVVRRSPEYRDQDLGHWSMSQLHPCDYSQLREVYAATLRQHDINVNWTF